MLPTPFKEVEGFVDDLISPLTPLTEEEENNWLGCKSSVLISTRSGEIEMTDITPQ
jgi:hypothetical protein